MANNKLMSFSGIVELVVQPRMPNELFNNVLHILSNILKLAVGALLSSLWGDRFLNQDLLVQSGSNLIIKKN